MIYIKKIDFIGTSIQFKFNGSTSNKTILEGILSLTSMILIFVLGLFQFMDLINKSNPSTYFSTKQADAVSLNLSKNLPIMFTVTDTGANVFPEVDSYVTFQGLSFYNFKNTTTNKIQTVTTNIGLVKCTKEFIQENYGQYANSFLLNLQEKNSFCVLMNQSQYFISGIQGQQPAQWVIFYLTYCDNSTSKVTCKPFDVIKQTSAFNVFASIPDYYFDHSNYENPGVYNVISKAFPMYPTLYMRYVLTFKNVIYNTDNGLLGKNEIQQNYFQQKVTTIFPSLTTASIVKNAIGALNLNFDSLIDDVYNRTYSKIPSILAQIGGSFNVLFYLSMILNYYFENKLKDIEVFNICCDGNMGKLITKQNLKSVQINNYINESEVQNQNSKKSEIRGFETSQKLGFPGISDLRLNHIKSSAIDEKNVKNSEPTNENNQLLKSILIDLKDLDDIINCEIRFWDFLKCNKENRVKRKFEVIERFVEQIFDIGFIFRNVLEAHILLSKKKN